LAIWDDDESDEMFYVDRYVIFLSSEIDIDLHVFASRPEHDGAISELGDWRQKRRQMPNHDASRSKKQKI
jgi:hypothetical protein